MSETQNPLCSAQKACCKVEDPSLKTTQDFIDLEKSYGALNYDPLPVVPSSAEGCWIWDVEGNRYLDMMSAYSAVSHGHRHPKLLTALHNQLSKICVTSRAFYPCNLGRFLKKLCEVSGLDRALPMNTGAEAVETAIKGARRWGEEVKGIPKDKCEIIVNAGNFHGRTTTVISFSSEDEYRRGFGPLTPGFREIPFGNLEALEQAITPNTCAFLTEPMLGEGGIKFPPKGWMKGVSELCRQHKVLLISDEIQTGLGRTGKMFGMDHEEVKPDAILLGKALGGGIYPVSAMIGTEELMNVFNPGSHGSTFGGNHMACAIGLKALEVLEEEGLVERSHTLGEYLLKALREIRSPVISNIRGRGLWIGMEVNPDYCNARVACERLLTKGILSKETKETVIRIAPPLTITREEIDWGVNRIESVLSSLEEDFGF